jgi:cyclophilin family peptidyl-prolyl cis-trans isomerase
MAEDDPDVVNLSLVDDSQRDGAPDDQPLSESLDDAIRKAEPSLLILATREAVAKLEDAEWVEQVTSAADADKKEGTELLKEGSLEEARTKYRLAVSRLRAAAVKRLPADSQSRQLERACILNLAQVSLRVEDWHACVACCNEILNSESVCKAFFRRGLAYAELELFGKAVKDVKEAARLEPANKEIRNVLDEIRQKWDEWKMRQRLPAPPPPPVHDLDALPEVWLDIAVGTEKYRLEIALYSDVVPHGAENFRCLCTGERGESEYGKLHYVGTVFHRIVPGLVAQAGDIQFRDDALLRGAGGGSIYGRFFDNEKQLDVHDRRGIVGMAHDGPNTNGSQFYITFAEAKHLDNQHLIVGEVVSGWDLLDALERVETDDLDAPVDLPRIVDSGAHVVGLPTF